MIQHNHYPMTIIVLVSYVAFHPKSYSYLKDAPNHCRSYLRSYIKEHAVYTMAGSTNEQWQLHSCCHN